MEMSPFATSGIETLLQGVCDEDVQTAIDLVILTALPLFLNTFS